MSELEFFQNMQDCMDVQAKKIWNMMQFSRGSGYRLRLGEVTATELSFFELRKYWTRGVYIDTNEPDESRTGADWEWIVGHDDAWLQIRVQAKIVNKSGSFAELGHPPTARGQQMHTLLNPPPEDRLTRWMPLYVFYAATPPVKDEVDQEWPVPVRGCSARLARQVRETYGPNPNGRANLAAHRHLPGTIPWSGIFSGLVRRLRSGESFIEVIDSLTDIPFPEDAASIDEFWLAHGPRRPRNREIPRYIQEILDTRDDSFESSSVSSLRIAFRENEESRRPMSEDPIIRRRGEKYAELPHRDLELTSDTRDERRLSFPTFVSVIDIDRI